MTKQAKNMTILTVVLLLLVTVLYFVKFFTGNMEATETDSAETLVDIVKEDIIRFSYDYEGETYMFEKVDDIWYYAEDYSLNITQYKINNMLSNVAPLKSLMLIDDATDMTHYGFMEEARFLTFETADAQYRYELGGENYVVEAAYIRVPDDSLVYVVEDAVVTTFNKTLEDLVEETSPAETTAE
uniref:DUF4340 domain-containing protein n=1 Tax=Acetatifactor sp. TaxID=1872090 RepID=UPI00405618B1